MGSPYRKAATTEISDSMTEMTKVWLTMIYSGAGLISLLIVSVTFSNWHTTEAEVRNSHENAIRQQAATEEMKAARDKAMFEAKAKLCAELQSEKAKP